MNAVHSALPHHSGVWADALSKEMYYKHLVEVQWREAGFVLGVRLWYHLRASGSSDSRSCSERASGIERRSIYLRNGEEIKGVFACDKKAYTRSSWQQSRTRLATHLIKDVRPCSIESMMNLAIT